MFGIERTLRQKQVGLVVCVLVVYGTNLLIGPTGGREFDGAKAVADEATLVCRHNTGDDHDPSDFDHDRLETGLRKAKIDRLNFLDSADQTNTG
jgi:hypothetical protein